MFEVDENFLEKGKFYLFFKEYKEYRDDIFIGQFVDYDDYSDLSRCAVINNYIVYEVQADFSIKRKTYLEDDTYDYLELTSEDHSTCWAFELDDDEINKHVLMELV
jgi:hypothetical protein